MHQGGELDDHASAALTRDVSAEARPALPGLSSLIDELAAPGRALVMVMGKGGVGKTTIAAAIAAELAARGHPVHLSTTDPAAHVASTLDGKVENLTISRIDPAAETKAYVDRVVATRGAHLDDAGKGAPCSEGGHRAVHGRGARGPRPPARPRARHGEPRSRARALTRQRHVRRAVRVAR